MLIYGADGSVCAYCYSADDVIAFARRQSPLRGAGSHVAPAVEDPGPMPPNVIRDLEETIRYLRQRWHQTIAERDEWENRARAAEQEVETLRTTAAGRDAGSGEAMDADAKFTALRRFLARELHPDASPVSEEVRLLKSDLFKVVWAEIARLDKA
jgi:Arc/MetJ-type ribon-helix-helix transcriptional regulator